MADSSNERVTCPDCGKGYRWQNTLVGRVVPCKHCDSKFTVPDAPGIGVAYAPEPTTNHNGTYELDLGEDDGPAPHASPAIGGKCPVCNTPIKENAVICMNCGFNLKEGKKMETAVADPVDADEQTAHGAASGPISRREQRDLEAAADAHREHQWIDYKLPIILIIAGCILTLTNNALLAPNAPTLSAGMGGTGETILVYTIATAYSVFVNGILLFAGLFVLLWLFGSSFGALGSVLLKVLAITVFAIEADFMTIAIFDLMTGAGFMAVLFSWAIYLGVMIGLCMKLLDLDAAEIRVLIVFIIVGRFAVDFSVDVLISML